MFAKPKVTRGEVLLSIFLGFSASLISLLLLWNGIGILDDEDKLLPVSNVAEEEIGFYATQHGMFSTQEAAASFQKQYPTLNKSVIVFVNDHYYLWSSLHISKTTMETTPASFSKAIRVNSNSCKEEKIAAIPKLLQDDKSLKNNFDAQQAPADWAQTITKISALTTEPAELRLLLLEHYRQQHTCLKIEFD